MVEPPPGVSVHGVVAPAYQLRDHSLAVHILYFTLLCSLLRHRKLNIHLVGQFVPHIFTHHVTPHDNSSVMPQK